MRAMGVDVVKACVLRLAAEVFVYRNGQHRGLSIGKAAPSKAAAVEVHKWMSKDILAGNGVFWPGYAAEKTCRAAVQHKPFTEVNFAAAAAARNTALVQYWSKLWTYV